MFQKLKDGLGKLDLGHPAVTWSALVSGLATITQTKEEWTILFGVIYGAKAFVLSKWFAAMCMAQVANGDLYRTKQ